MYFIFARGGKSLGDFLHKAFASAYGSIRVSDDCDAGEHWVTV